MEKEFFTITLLNWAKHNLLDYPWRRYTDPYNMLITEILLRKTNSEKVMNIIESTLERIPNIHELSSIPLNELEELLKPYGMSKVKALQLNKLAHQIITDFNGVIPNNKAGISSLYGVGNYICNALLSFCYSQKVSIVDTNVIRIITRFFGFDSTKKRVRDDKAIWELVDSVLPEENVRLFNYALLDYPKLICKLKSPQCSACVLKAECNYYLDTNPNSY